MSNPEFRVRVSKNCNPRINPVGTAINSLLVINAILEGGILLSYASHTGAGTKLSLVDNK